MQVIRVCCEDRAMPAKVYVIRGSHACRTATLMLRHKGIPYRVIVLPTGPHPLLVRPPVFPGTAPRFAPSTAGRTANSR
jgi:hypothetical protein